MAADWGRAGSKRELAAGSAAAKRQKVPTASGPQSMEDLETGQFIAIVAVATILSLVGGVLNGVALAGVFGTALTHLTGTTTRAATSLLMPPSPTLPPPYFWWAHLGAMTLGAFVASLILGRDRAKVRLRQTAILCLEALLLWLVPAAVHHGLAGGGVVAGELLVAVACGMQNVVMSNLRYAKIRTTHVTGTMVDIGTALAFCITDGGCARHGWKLAVWCPTVFGFWLGALLGTAAYLYLREGALYLGPALVSLLAVAAASWTFAHRRRAPAPNESPPSPHSYDTLTSPRSHPDDDEDDGEIVVENVVGDLGR